MVHSSSSRLKMFRKRRSTGAAATLTHRTFIILICILMGVYLFVSVQMALQLPDPVINIVSVSDVTVKEEERGVKVKVTSKHTMVEDQGLSPNLHAILESKSCLPSDMCAECIEQKNCRDCGRTCSCFCDHLCKVSDKKNINDVFEYTILPQEKKQKQRLIPRIVHQTWMEQINPEKYPAKSFIQSSWRQNGWEYRFYDDKNAADFIEKHFPHQVLEAYNALIPGAYKADLFRYCVLFIHGGVYADYDVLCQSDLDQAVDKQVGFFVPVDLDRCLWNGLIGSAPGHPFIAAAIETVANSVRNRFTVVDIMNSMCYDGKIALYDQAHKDLYLTGPCLLGKVVNQVLGRPPQSTFDLDDDYKSILESKGIAGSLQLMEYRKKFQEFMGAEMFILRQKNLIVAATNFPKDPMEKGTNPSPHYSNLNQRGKLYGTFGIYTNMICANEDIQFVRVTPE